MRRVFIVTGCWFLLWMSLGVTFSVMAKGLDGLFSGQ